MSDTTIQLLCDLGLSRTEAKIYLALESEDKTVMELSKRVEIARTSVYAGLEKLLGVGLVEKIVEYKKQRYRRGPPEMFKSMVVTEEERVEKMKKSSLELQDILAIKTNKIKTEVRYYHGRQGFQQMMWNALGANKESVGWSEFGRVEVVGEKFIKNWVTEFKARKLIDRVLANPTKRVIDILKAQIDTKDHQLKSGGIRLVPEKTMYISGDTTIYNNVFAVCWWKGEEVVGVEIENEELVKTQRSLFEAIWRKAEIYKK
jgi:sugar-specific transcriptional regulator TrmB